MKAIKKELMKDNKVFLNKKNKKKAAIWTWTLQKYLRN